MNKDNKKEDKDKNGNEYEHAFLFWANINFYRDYKDKKDHSNIKNTMTLEEGGGFEFDNEDEDFNLEVNDEVNNNDVEDSENIMEDDRNDLISNILDNTNANISLSNIEKSIISESSFFYNAHLLFESKIVNHESKSTFFSPLYINQEKSQGGLGSVTFGLVAKGSNPKEADNKFWEKAADIAADLNDSEFDIYVEISHADCSLLPYSVACERLSHMNTLVINNMKKISKLANRSRSLRFDSDSENNKDENIRDMMEEIGEAIKSNRSEKNSVKMPDDKKENDLDDDDSEEKKNVEKEENDSEEKENDLNNNDDDNNDDDNNDDDDNGMRLI